MRQELIDYFKGLKSRTFGVSEELPFTSGNILYLKNPKKVYVDRPQSSQEQVIAVLGNHGVFQEVQTVSVFFATDAKTLPSDYESFISQMKAGKDVEDGQPFFRREVDVVTSYENDLMVTQLDFRFTKLT